MMRKVRSILELRRRDPAFALRALGIAALFAGTAVFAGCKGNTSAAASPEPVVHRPPGITARPLPPDMTPELLTALCTQNPVENSLWQGATWVSFTSPVNTAATTPATRGAFLYDAANLYVGVVCRKSVVIPTEKLSDTVSFFLDTHDEGKELLQIAVSLDSEESSSDAHSGESQITWFRTTAAAQPLESGAPNFDVPIDRRPNLKLPGIQALIHEFSDGGSDAWSAVIRIPVASLPGPLQTAPGATAWKVNLIRTLTNTASGKHLQQTQSNLSPVFIGAQAVSPYRLATLEFVK